MNGIKISDSGDSAIFCRVGDNISTEVNMMVYALENSILEKGIKGIIETVPSYNGVMIYYDPLVLDREKINSLIESVGAEDLKTLSNTDARTIVIPVIYGQEYGPDLELVSETNNLSTREVIAIHTQNDYRIYMLGFTPGFPYLGGMDKRIAAPRKKEPRLRIAAGSVGIAGEQTGIYPIESPGGWQIIGRTPVALFNPDSETPFLLEPGLSLRFRHVEIEEYREIERLVARMEYRPEIIPG